MANNKTAIAQVSASTIRKHGSRTDSFATLSPLMDAAAHKAQSLVAKYAGKIELSQATNRYKITGHVITIAILQEYFTEGMDDEAIAALFSTLTVEQVAAARAFVEDSV